MTKPRRYIDFKLYLSRAPGSENDFQVSLLPTPEVGESILPTRFTAEDLPAQNMVRLLETKNITLRNLIELGQQLTNCLLPVEGGLRDAFRSTYRQARTHDDLGLRLRLVIADHELKELPWEFFYLNLRGGPEGLHGFPLLNGHISMVRHEPRLMPHPTVRNVGGQEDIKELRMALVSSLPAQQRELDLDRETRSIKSAVQGFVIDGVRLAIEPEIESATPEDIATLPKGTFIFHFAGHGTVEEKLDKGQRGGEMKREGALLLVADKESRREKVLRAAELAAYLDNAGVRLAVLAACHSARRDSRYPWDDVAGALTAAGIPAVIAMQQAIEDPAAIAFSGAFYAALASGLSLDEAMFAGRRAMISDLQTSPTPDTAVPIEWGVPVLYSRLPDGKLFPERMNNAHDAAAQYRTVIKDAIDVVTEDGKVTVIKADRVKNGFQVFSKVGIMEGPHTVAKLGKIEEGASIYIESKIDEVRDEHIGLDVGEI
jgi:hypothetical protein